MIRHYDVNGKICPNQYVYNHTKHTWAAFKAALSGTTPAPTPMPPVTDSVYRVQTGAFKDKKLADSLAAALKALGFETCIKQSDGLYKVQVGAFSIRANADTMLKKLQSYGYEGFIVGVNSSEKEKKVRVTTDVLNIRSGPDTGYTATGQIAGGGVYTITETQGSWGKLKSGAGWICLDYTTDI